MTTALPLSHIRIQPMPEVQDGWRHWGRGTKSLLVSVPGWRTYAPEGTDTVMVSPGDYEKILKILIEPHERLPEHDEAIIVDRERCSRLLQTSSPT